MLKEQLHKILAAALVAHAGREMEGGVAEMIACIDERLCGVFAEQVSDHAYPVGADGLMEEVVGGCCRGLLVPLLHVCLMWEPPPASCLPPLLRRDLGSFFLTWAKFHPNKIHFFLVVILREPTTHEHCQQGWRWPWHAVGGP